MYPKPIAIGNLLNALFRRVAANFDKNLAHFLEAERLKY